MKHRKALAILSIVVLILLACGTTKTVLEATPSSTPTPIPGWNKFTASGVEMWFPESWEGGDLENDLDVIVGKLKTLGPDYDQIVQMIEANPSAFVLWIFDTKLGEAGYLTNANIVKEQVISAITLEMYLDALKKQLPSSFVITDQKTVQLNQYESARVELSMDVAGTLAKELMYIVKEKNTIWAITFATSSSEFESRVPVFEQIAGTFYIQP